MPNEEVFRSGAGMRAIMNCCLLIALLAALLPDLRLHAETWSRKEDLPTARGGAAAVVFDGKIWLIGGNTVHDNLGVVNVFDPATGSWVTKASLPTRRGNIAAAVVNGQIYTFGGGLDVLSNSVEVFNTTTNKWAVKDTMPVRWKGTHAVVYNGIVYLLGGSTRSDSYGDSLCYAFNPATGAWTKLASRPAPGPCGVALYRGEIYTFGGHKGLEDPVIPATLIYSPGTNTWRKGPDMPTPRTGLQAYLVEGKIYVIGGWQVKDTAVASVEVYDPLKDSWRKTDDMPVPLCYHAGTEVDGKIYVMGGSSDWETGGERTYEYDPAPPSVTGKWETTLAGVPTPRGGASASVVDGKIYLIGGSTAQVNLNPNEVYDPATNTWQVKKPMPTARGYHAAAVVDGVIYTFGGALNGTSNVVEAYNPATDTWSPRNPLPVALTSVKAVVKDGLVYLLGLKSNFTDMFFCIYNPATDAYTAKTLPPATGGAGAVLYRGLIYTFGGGGWLNATTSGPVSATVCVYDPATDTWTRKADMPTARAGLQTYLVNGKIYVLGGFQTHSSALATVEVYDPLKDSWQAGMTMPRSLCFFSGAEVDGTMYALGGSGDWWNGGEYNYAYDPNFEVSTGAAEALASVVRSFELFQNYPNPFNPSTIIRFSLKERSHVTLAVNNLLGQMVAELINGDLTAGTHEVRFNAGRLASGLYLYRLQSGEFSQTRSLLLLK